MELAPLLPVRFFLPSFLPSMYIKVKLTTPPESEASGLLSLFTHAHQTPPVVNPPLTYILAPEIECRTCFIQIEHIFTSLFALHLYRCAPKNQNVSTVCFLRCCWNWWTTTCCVVAVVVDDCVTKKESAGHSKNSANYEGESSLYSTTVWCTRRRRRGITQNSAN